MAQFIRKTEEKLDAIPKVFMRKLADKAVAISPVDTGAYVESHSIRATRGGGRSRTSHGRPKGVDPGSKKAEARGYLEDDISALPDDMKQAYLNNHSPHASLVEYTHGYNVYNTVRNVAPQLLQDAIREVRDR
jgi:hypothetical protein